MKEIKDMLERGINNMEQYQITDERLVRDAAEQLKVALKQDMIELKDLMDLRIGGLVNNIRKNNRQNNNLKSLLRGLVHDMQARARDAPKNGVAAAVANPANGTTAPKPVRRTPPVKNGDVVNGGEKRVTPVENVQHPRLHDLKEEKKPKSRKSPKSRTKSPPTPPPGQRRHHHRVGCIRHPQKLALLHRPMQLIKFRPSNSASHRPLPITTTTITTAISIPPPPPRSTRNQQPTNQSQLRRANLYRAYQ